MSERDRCPRNSCLCLFFIVVSLSLALSLSPPPFCIASIQLTTPPHCNFCVTHFPNTHTSSSTQWAAKLVHEVSRSYHFIWCESDSVCVCVFPVFACVCFSFSCTLDSCSLYCLTSFLPPLSLALPGALAAVISMFSSKSPWKRGMGV